MAHCAETAMPRRGPVRQARQRHPAPMPLWPHSGTGIPHNSSERQGGNGDEGSQQQDRDSRHAARRPTVWRVLIAMRPPGLLCCGPRSTRSCRGFLAHGCLLRRRSWLVEHQPTHVVATRLTAVLGLWHRNWLGLSRYDLCGRPAAPERNHNGHPVAQVGDDLGK